MKYSLAVMALLGLTSVEAIQHHHHHHHNNLVGLTGDNSVSDAGNSPVVPAAKRVNPPAANSSDLPPENKARATWEAINAKKPAPAVKYPPLHVYKQKMNDGWNAHEAALEGTLDGAYRGTANTIENQVGLEK